MRRALIGDIHGNLEALDVVLGDIAGQRIDEINNEYDLGAAKVMINIGSVGQPRDGDDRACYVILDDGRNAESTDGADKRGMPVSSPRITYRRLPYDFRTTIRKLSDIGRR